jgi:hypothetical protein
MFSTKKNFNKHTMPEVLLNLVERFLFESEKPRRLQLTLASISIILFLKIISIYPVLELFFSERGVLTKEEAAKAAPYIWQGWINLAPSSEIGLQTAALIALVAAITNFCLVSRALTQRSSVLGQSLSLWIIRFSSVYNLFFIAILQSRNNFVWNSGDKLIFLALLGLTLWLFSLDSKMPHISSPWNCFYRRIFQLQISLVYVVTFAAKIHGPTWREGTATWIPLHLPEFEHFYLGALRDFVPFTYFSTYGTLAVEFALGTLIWIPRLRIPLLICGILFHLGLDYAINIPLFQWVVITFLLTFLKPDEMSWNQIRSKCKAHVLRK